MGAQYVSDETGKRTAVWLPIEDYERLLDALQDLAAIAERRDEVTVSHEDLITELKRDGLLPA
jgi:sugar phosphate isomerase/epimerase